MAFLRGGGDNEEDSARLGGSSPVVLCCLGRDVKRAMVEFFQD